MQADELAKIIANVLGAGEMLNATVVDATHIIEKVLHAPELYADFLVDFKAPSKPGATIRPNCI